MIFFCDVVNRNLFFFRKCSHKLNRWRRNGFYRQLLLGFDIHLDKLFAAVRKKRGTFT